MLSMLKKLFQLLSKREKRDFFIMQFFMLLTALAELFSTISILPFMALAANPLLHTQNSYIVRIHDFMGSPSDEVFLFILGAVFGVLVLVSNALLLLSQFLMNRFSFRLGREMSSKLFRYYLSKELRFHTQINSSKLIQKTMRDAHMLSGELFTSALKLNGRIFSILFLTSLLFIVSFWVATMTVVMLAGSYALVFLVVRKRISQNSLKQAEYDRQRTRWLNEGFEGIKDIKLYSAESMFVERYYLATKHSNRINSDNLLLAETPYYLIDSIVLCGVVLATLYFISQQNSLTHAIPTLTLFCMAGYKLVPKIQQGYNCITQIRRAQPIFEHLYDDLKMANALGSEPRQQAPLVNINNAIEMRNVRFSYKDRELFNSLDIHIPAKKITAIIGPSGIGKSTLLDIFMGLTMPESGQLFIDGKPLNRGHLEGWKASVGYVPQLVYLTDATIAENIAFGVELKNIDMSRVERAARLANLHEFIEDLPHKYLENTGERGNRISGGQRQRLGIARAFYRDISVLVLDEATSALDNATQSAILNGLKSMNPPMTIVMVTHREETMAYADNIIDVGQSGLRNAVF